MELIRSAVIPVEEQSQIGEARRRAATIAGAVGFSTERISDISIIASELASNLVKHGKKGLLVAQSLHYRSSEVAIEIIAIDKGPGMSDPKRCMEDGYSTVGTLGTGLGAVRRLSNQFDLLSEHDHGTTVWCRCGDTRRDLLIAPYFDCLCIPMEGENVCGDGWSMKKLGASTRFMVADGLGHGPEAAEAARAAAAIFDSSESSLEAIMIRMHEQLRATRGAVVAIAEVNAALGSVMFCGIGNIAVTIEGATRQHLLSNPGIVGYEARKFSTSRHPWSSDSILIMHSDGLASLWGLDQYSGLRQKPAGILAGRLFRDRRKAHDDCVILVYKAHQ